MELHRPQLAAMIEALIAIFSQGYPADKVIERQLRGHRQWGARDRRQFAEVVYDCVRWWRRLNGLRGAQQLGAEPGAVRDLASQVVREVIQIHLSVRGGFQLPSDWQVENAQAQAWQNQWQDPNQPPAIRHSLPDWLEERSRQELGVEWPTIAEALNTQAPVFLRVNRLKADPETVLRRLNEEGVKAQKVEGLSDALVLLERRNVFVTSAFKGGLFEVQDGGSQQVVPLLKAQPSERIIDACAGAGGKTLHLAAHMKNRGRIVALDVHGRKLDELKVRARRAGVDIIEVRAIDSNKVLKRLRGSADRVLLDVPCSGSGVWRRNPDSRWRLTAQEVTRLHELQSQILTDYSRLVRAEGVVVYATCSLWPSENQHQVQKFLAQSQGEFHLEEELTIRPDESPFDGFYAARLVRLR